MKKHLITLTVYWIDGAAIALNRSRQIAENTQTKKQAAFVRVDAIGDFILWMSTFDELQKTFPKSEYSWLLVCNSSCYELAHGTGLFDAIISVHLNRFLKDFRYRLSLLKRLANIRVDFAFHPTFSRGLRTGDAVIRALHSPEKIAPAGDLSNATLLEKFLGNRSYSRILATTPSPLMELQRNAEILSLFTERQIAPKRADLLPLAKKSSISPPKEHYFVIFPGASWHGREWPFDRFLEIAQRVQSRTGWLCVFAGSSEDEKRFHLAVTQVAQLRSLNLQGKTTLVDLVALISGARLLLTNETSAAHIGNATNVPMVSILGGGHFGRFLPWDTTKMPTSQPERENSKTAYQKMPCFNCNWACVHKVPPNHPMPCLSGITVDSIWQAVCTIVDFEKVSNTPATHTETI